MNLERENYLLSQPKSLEHMAIKKFVEWIASHAEKLAETMKKLEERYPTKAQELLSRHIEIIRNHIECRLPGVFHNEAMTELQKELYRFRINADLCGKHNTVLDSMMGTLFTKNITFLSFRYNYWEISLDSLRSKAHLLTGLTQLTLNSICSDEILKRIEKNLNLIETLDLSGSKVSDDCIDTLIGLVNLRNVNLRNTKVSEAGVERILTTCPNIECIVADVNMAEVISSYLKKHDVRLFNLKSYENTPKATLEQQQLIVKTCPLIEKLRIDDADGYVNTDTNLNVFQDLQNLLELVLYDCQFYTCQVKDFLQTRGSNLVYLHLCQNLQIDFSALKHIYFTCPNLQHFDLRECPFDVGMIFWENDIIPCEETILPLKYLKKLSVTGHTSQRPEDHFIFLLSNCPNVEYVNINGRVELLDNVILEVLQKNPNNLRHLKELRFCGHLSKFVIDRIVQNCINPLNVVSRENLIMTWD